MVSRTESPGRPDYLAAAAVFLLALVLRLLYVRDIDRAGLGDFLRLDPLYYHEWARRIAGGDWLGREPFEMSPLYPYALAVAYRVFGISLTVPYVLQAILGALTCAGTSLLARRIFGRASGALAGTLLAVYGPAVYYDGQINKTTLALALSLAFSGALLLSEGRREVWIALSGCALGLTAMVHENVIVAAPIAMVWLLFPRDPAAFATRIARAAIFAAGCAAAVAPAAARNVAVSGEYVLITTGGGENFYTGNHEHASGRYSPPPFVRPDPFFEHEDFRREAARRLGREVTRSESSRFWWREGLRSMTESPGRFLWLIGDKFAVFFNAFERPDNFSYYNFRVFSPTLSLPLLSFGILAPLAAIGLAFSAPRWRELTPLYAGFGAYVISALIFFTQSRYRMPAVPFLAVFAGYGAVRMAELMRERRFRALAGAAFGLAAVFLFVNRDPGNAPSFHAQNEAILGEMYLHAGRLDDAAASFQRGIEGLRQIAEPPDPVLARIAGAAQYGLGVTQRRRENMEAAERAFLSAADASDPDVRADAALELASLLRSRGDDRSAAAALGVAAAARPGDVPIRLRYAEALFGIGRVDDSLAQVNAVLSARPEPAPSDLADAHYGAAMIHLARGDAAAARAEMRRTLELSPRHPRAAWMRGMLGSGDGQAP